MTSIDTDVLAPNAASTPARTFDTCGDRKSRETYVTEVTGVAPAPPFVHACGRRSTSAVGLGTPVSFVHTSVAWSSPVVVNALPSHTCGARAVNSPAPARTTTAWR